MNWHVAESIAGVALVMSRTLPLIRLLKSEAFRKSFPGISLAALLATCAALVSSIAAAVYWPLILRIAAGGAVFAHVFLWWRARPGYGRARGLPPGSLALLPVEAWTNVRFFQDQADRFGPVFKMSHFSCPMVCVVGFEPAIEILREQDDVSLRSPENPFSRYLPCGILRGMAPDLHKVYRRMIQSAVQADVVRDSREWIGAEVRRALDRIAADSKTADGVFPQPYFEEMVFRIFLRLFFGVVPRSAEFEEIAALYRDVLKGSARRATLRWLPSFRRVVRAIDRITAILMSQVERWHGSGEYPRCFLAEVARSNPEAVHDRSLTGNLIFLVQASSLDLMGLAQWLTRMLLDNPRWEAPLREEAAVAAPGDDGPGARFVQEALRMEQSEHVYRTVTREFRYGEWRIPKGWLLRICVRESHRAGGRFPDPDRFEPDRFSDARFPKTVYSPFGFLRRACLGEQLTREVARMFLHELVSGYDIRLVSCGEREFVGWHWTPGSEFRIAVTARQDSLATA